MVGASSGIGEAMARQLVVRGVKVVLIARRLERLETIAAELEALTGESSAIVMVHDVRNHQEAASVFQEAATRLGGLDLVIYASGIMPEIADSTYPTDVDVSIIETNLVGAVAWLNAAADRFQRAGSGTIVGVSSVAGERGRHSNSVYGATKAAFNTYLASLQARLARCGVSVVIAKPGYVQTALIEGRKMPSFPPTIGPERAATEILRAAAAGQRVAYIPAWWRFVMLIVRIIPAPIFERLKI